MSTPIASVLIPVYNAEEYLGEAIESALGQTRRDIEVVAIDDGSTDSSRDILRCYAKQDSRLKMFENAHNGLVDTLNCGLVLAQGKYICRLDADDIAEPSRIEMQVRFLEKHADYALVGGNVTAIAPDGSLIGKFQLPTCHDVIVSNLQVANCFFHSAVTFRKESILEAGGYDPFFFPAEDYELWVRLSTKCRLANIPAVVCRYRVHARQVSCVQLTMQVFAAMAIRARFRGLSTIELKSLLGSLNDISIEQMERLGYSRKEIGNDLTNGYLLSAMSLRGIRRLDLAGSLLVQAEQTLRALRVCRSNLGDIRIAATRVEYESGHFANAFAHFGRALGLSPLRTICRSAKHLQTVCENQVRPKPM
jgi:glycosyltransferase involved in cell wall biosynthesis